MLIKRILLLLPILIAAALLQSYFWVPTFSDQTKGGSDARLRQFITGSIGDAQILNPILHADAASGAIVDQVFEGLIDRDRDLSYRGRLASSWKIYEEAFFVPHPEGRERRRWRSASNARARQAGRNGLKTSKKSKPSHPRSRKPPSAPRRPRARRNPERKRSPSPTPSG